MISKGQLELLQKEARQDGVDMLVGALIMRSDGRLFGVRRSWSRKLFPGCWDIAGGHVERGEWITEALEREVREETGWALDHVVGLVGIFEWFKEYGAIAKKVREFEFLVRIADEKIEPVVEKGMVDEYHWFSMSETWRLHENRKAGDDFMFRVFNKGFEIMSKRHDTFLASGLALEDTAR
jgi:8-oxo-dGTP pyrophosphatase MutT (NUDIX family)